MCLTSAPSQSTFKSYLKTFLFHCTFNTSVTYWLFIHLYIYIYIFFHPYFTSAVGLHLFVVQRSYLSCMLLNKLACYIHTYIHTYIHIHTYIFYFFLSSVHELTLFITKDAVFVLFWYSNSWSIYSNTICY